MIVADTNVVSELMRDQPDARVLAWAESLDANAVTISVVTVQEIEHGLARLAPGRRQRALTDRWHGLLDAYAESLLVYDVPAAQAAATALAVRAQAGRPMMLADAEIAGICVSRCATLATRNTADFEGISGLALVDPFA